MLLVCLLIVFLTSLGLFIINTISKPRRTLIRELRFYPPFSEKGRSMEKRKDLSLTVSSSWNTFGTQGDPEQNELTQAFLYILLAPPLKPTDKALHTNSLAAHSAKVILTPKAHSALENKKEHMHSGLFD